MKQKISYQGYTRTSKLKKTLRNLAEVDLSKAHSEEIKELIIASGKWIRISKRESISHKLYGSAVIAKVGPQFKPVLKSIGIKYDDKQVSNLKKIM